MKPETRKLICLDGVSPEMWQSVLDNPKLTALHHFSYSQGIINELSSNQANLISLGTGSSYLDHQIHSSYIVENSTLRITSYKDRKALYVWETLDQNNLQTISVGWPANHENLISSKHLADVFGTDLSEADRQHICAKDKELLNFWLLPSELNDEVIQQFIKLDDPHIFKFKSIFAEFISKHSVYINLIQTKGIVFSTIYLSVFAQLRAASFSDYVITNVWLLVNSMVEQLTQYTSLGNIDLLINYENNDNISFLSNSNHTRLKKSQDWSQSILNHFRVLKRELKPENKITINPIIIEHTDLDFFHLLEKRNLLFCYAESLEKVHQYTKALEYWKELSILFPELEAARSNYCRCLIINNHAQKCLLFLEEHSGFESSVIFQAYEILANIALLNVDQAFLLLERTTKTIEASEVQPTVDELRFLCYFRQWRTLKLTCDKILNWQDNYRMARYFSNYAEAQLESGPKNNIITRVQWNPFQLLHQQWVSEWSVQDPIDKLSKVDKPMELILSALEQNDLNIAKQALAVFQDQGVTLINVKFVDRKDIFSLPIDSHILIIIKDSDKNKVQHPWNKTLSLADQTVFGQEIQHRWLSACRENFNNVIETCDSRVLHLSTRIRSLIPSSHIEKLETILNKLHDTI